MPEVRLIDANALKKAVADAFYNLHEIAYIADIIERQPTIDAEPVRHGRWIELPESWQADYECSECGAGIGKIKPPYCDLCGARMDGGADE